MAGRRADKARGVPTACRTPKPRASSRKFDLPLLPKFRESPLQKVCGRQACHEPMRRAAGLSTQRARHFRVHLPKQRQHDRNRLALSQVCHLNLPTSRYVCVRAPHPARAPLRKRIRSYASKTVTLQGLSMLRAASQAFHPREFSRKSHCPLLPKSEVRAERVINANHDSPVIL